MLFDVKLRGLVNISHQEDVDRIIKAFHILGEKIRTDQLVTGNGISLSENLVDIKDESEDPMIVTVEDPWNVNIKDNINIDMEDSVEDFGDVDYKKEESDSVAKNVINKKLDKQIKTKKRAALKVRDKCSGCKYYSRRGAIRAHILEAHTEIDMGIRKETVETEISNMSYLQTVCTKKRFYKPF